MTKTLTHSPLLYTYHQIPWIDPSDDFYSPITNCLNFLIDLATHRKKHTFMGILTFAQSILQKYLDSPLATRIPQEKDGALAIVGCLEQSIMKKVCQVLPGCFHVFLCHSHLLNY